MGDERIDRVAPLKVIEERRHGYTSASEARRPAKNAGVGMDLVQPVGLCTPELALVSPEPADPARFPLARVKVARTESLNFQVASNQRKTRPVRAGCGG